MLATGKKHRHIVAAISPRHNIHSWFTLTFPDGHSGIKLSEQCYVSFFRPAFDDKDPERGLLKHRQ